MLTTILGIVGAIVASYLGQALGWYAPGEGAGLIGAVVGAIVVLFVWGAHRQAARVADSKASRAVVSVDRGPTAKWHPDLADKYGSRYRESGAMLWLIPVVIVVLAAAWIWLMMCVELLVGRTRRVGAEHSQKGWVCKTWEGELALVTMPGTAQEKFLFTVWDHDVATKINAAMGKRVSLHYEEKVGLPGSCFGDTRHWVNGVKAVEDIPLAPG